MIIKDLRKKQDLKDARILDTSDLCRLLLDINCNPEILGKLIENNVINVRNISLSDLVRKVYEEYEDKIELYEEGCKLTELDKLLLYNCDTTKISKSLYSKLLCLNLVDDYEYVESLAKNVEDIDNMLFFYDYSENSTNGYSIKIDIYNQTGIYGHMLYPCCPTNLFKNEYFSPTLITNLTGEKNLLEEDYDSYDYDVIIINK